MRALSTEKVRHLLLRAEQGDLLPGSLSTELRDQAVTCGWLRGSGVLADVELRAYGSGSLAPARRIEGPVHVVALEGSVGLAAGDVSFGLRAIIARETDRGLETLAGEITSARVVALEILVAAFDEHAIVRAVDPGAQIALLGEPGKPNPVREAAADWQNAMAASAIAPADKPKIPAAQGSQPSLAAPIPPRPTKPQDEEPEGVVPEAGDVVEHFAFGKCEVLKSEGDRLYLRMAKDGRIKEIALEMLKVTPLGEEDGKRAYKLARRT